MKQERHPLTAAAFALLLLLAGAPAVTRAQTTPPPPAPPRPVNVPTPAEKTLSNGLRVIHAPRTGSGLVSFQVIVKAGGAQDPEGKAGAASLAASLLTQGAGNRTAPQIAEAVEALGGDLSASAGRDTTSVRLNVMRRNLSAAMPVLADVVIRPTFPKAELERQRAQTLDSLAVSLGEPSTLGSAVTDRVVYGGTPYGNMLSGTPSSVKALTTDDVRSFHARYFLPRNALVVVAGDITQADAFTLAERHFGGWKPANGAGSSAGAPPDVSFSVPEPGTGRVVVIDKPDVGQAAVFVARVGIARRDPQYHTALVTNSVLGGGYSSRLNQEVRIKRGLSYGAGSRLDARRQPGPFRASAQTKHESASEVVDLVLAQIRRLGTSDVPGAELTTRKAVITGSFARDLEPGSGLAARVADLAVSGLPLTDLRQFSSRVRAVTPAQVREFAATRLAPDTMNVVVVGDASKFADALKARFGADRVEIIPAASVNLDAPALQ